MSSTQHEYAPGDIVRVKKGTMLVESYLVSSRAHPAPSTPPNGAVATVVRVSPKALADDIICLTFWCRPGVEWITWVGSLILVNPAQTYV